MDLKSIQKMCEGKMCIRCPLFKYEGAKLSFKSCDCLFLDIPANWDVEEIERRLEEYGKEEKN